MKDLKDVILAAQKSDNDSMYEIIQRFYPIIIKYTRKMRYDEDFKSDMILHLIETILAIDLTKFRIPNDYALINYISNVLYHKYIDLSKKQVSRRQNENFFEIKDIEEWLGVDETTTKEIDNILLENSMKDLLTEREYACVKLMVIEGVSSTEASKILGISRQTVNENKNRGLNKLKKAFEKQNHAAQCKC